MSQALGPMVRPDPLGSPDMTLACLRAAEVDLDLCCDGDLMERMTRSVDYKKIIEKLINLFWWLSLTNLQSLDQLSHFKKKLLTGQLSRQRKREKDKCGITCHSYQLGYL